jgi:hypothetical protein
MLSEIITDAKPDDKWLDSSLCYLQEDGRLMIPYTCLVSLRTQPYVGGLGTWDSSDVDILMQQSISFLEKFIDAPNLLEDNQKLEAFGAIYQARQNFCRIQDKGKHWQVQEQAKILTGNYVILCASNEPAFDIVIVFKDAELDCETFDLVLLDQRKLVYDGGLEKATYEKDLPHCSEFCDQLKSVLQNPRFIYGVVDPVKLLTHQANGMGPFLKEHNGLLFGMGVEECRAYHTVFRVHPIVNPIVAINSSYVDRNQLALCLPREWTKRKARADALLAWKTTKGPISSVDMLCSASTLPDEAIPPCNSGDFSRILFLNLLE